MPDTDTLEERVESLELKFEDLLIRSDAPREKNWRCTIGQFTGDDEMKEIFDEALRLREEDRLE